MQSPAQPPALASGPGPGPAPAGHRPSTGSPNHAVAPHPGAAVHLDYIRLVAEANPAHGPEDVEAFHRALFLQQFGPGLERAREQRGIHERKLEGLESRLTRLRSRLDVEDPLVPVVEDGRPDVEPTAPWNLWDRAMFAVGTLAILALLVFGVLNVSFNLLESGIVTFSEHPVRAYFWAALLPVGALAAKIGWDFLPGRRARTIYLWSCLGLGLAAVVAWLGAYASVYPNLSRTTADQIASLSVFTPSAPAAGTTANGVRYVDMLLVSSQSLAEICLSAALGIYLTQLYARHRPVRLAPNPAFTQRDADRQALEDEITEHRQALADQRGTEDRIQNQLAVTLAYARSLFHREIALRRDRDHRKRAILDEIADEVRYRLARVDEEADRAATSDIRPTAPALVTAAPDHNGRSALPPVTAPPSTP